MKIGVCASPSKAGIVADAGADFLELSVRGDLVPESDDATWARNRALIESLPLPVEVFSLFLPGDMKIVGEAIDEERTDRYVTVAFARAAQVGASVIVLGSGGSRRVPDGFSRETAEGQIRDFLNLCADASGATGVVLAVEPLNRNESNIINSVSEGAGYVRACGKPGICLLADSYHMDKDGEPVTEATVYGSLLIHAHTADIGRKPPGTGTYDHAAFFDALRTGGYNDRISIECEWGDFDREVAPAIAHLRRFA